MFVSLPKGSKAAYYMGYGYYDAIDVSGSLLPGVSWLSGIVFDPNNSNIAYFADSWDETGIYKIDLSNNSVSNLTETPGSRIQQITIDSSGQYIYAAAASGDNGIIRINTTTGAREFLFQPGDPGVPSYVNDPAGVLISQDDSKLYIGDFNNSHTIYSYDLTGGTFEFLAGTEGIDCNGALPAVCDGIGAAAKLWFPVYLDWKDEDTIVFFDEYDGYSLRTLDINTKEVNTPFTAAFPLVEERFVGFHFIPGTNHFYALDNSPDDYKQAVHKIDFDDYSVLETFTTTDDTSFSNTYISGVDISPDGKTLLAVDSDNLRLLKFNIDTGTGPSGLYSVKWHSGDRGYTLEYGDKYTYATDYSSDMGSNINVYNNYLYVGDSFNYCVRKINVSTGASSLSDVVTGLCGTGGDAVGDAADARFSTIRGLTVDKNNGDIYINDYGNDKIKKYTASTQTVTTLVDYALGPLSRPYGLKVSPDSSTLYISDRGINKLYKANTDTGALTFMAGGGLNAEGTGAEVQFIDPNGIDITSSGEYLYMADDYSIRKINTTNDSVTVVAGLYNTQGYQDGIGTSARIMETRSVVLDDQENYLYFVDRQADMVRMVDLSNNEVTSIAGGSYYLDTGGSGGNSVEGNGLLANLSRPTSLDIFDQHLYVQVDENNIWTVEVNNPPVPTPDSPADPDPEEDPEEEAPAIVEEEDDDQGENEEEVAPEVTEEAAEEEGETFEAVPTDNRTEWQKTWDNVKKSVEETAVLVQGVAIDIIKETPEPVAYTFPYLLFGLLAFFAYRLSIQARSEISQSQKIMNVVRMEKVIAEDKENFIALSSHYLRTPLTIIKGGFDEAKMSTVIKTKLGKAIKALEEEIVGILKAIENNKYLKNIKKPNIQKEKTKIYLSPYLWLPALSVVVIAGVANYLFETVAEYDINIINYITQGIAGLIAIQFFVSVYRKKHNAKKNLGNLKEIEKYEHAMDGARNKFIDTTEKALRNKLKTVTTGTNSVKGDSARHFKEGKERFERILTNLAILADIKAGKRIKDKKDFIVTNTINKILTEKQKEIKVKNITIDTKGTLGTIHQNKELVEHVLNSIIDNAIKFNNKDGGIMIALSGSKGVARVSIQDTGDGISKEGMLHLFKPFTRTGSAMHFNYEGFGFSLFLSKIIAEYMGGDVQVKSEKGKGTIVDVMFEM